MALKTYSFLHLRFIWTIMFVCAQTLLLLSAVMQSGLACNLICGIMGKTFKAVQFDFQLEEAGIVVEDLRLIIDVINWRRWSREMRLLPCSLWVKVDKPVQLNNSNTALSPGCCQQPPQGINLLHPSESVRGILKPTLARLMSENTWIYLHSLLDPMGWTRIFRGIQVCQKEGVDQRGFAEPRFSWKTKVGVRGGWGMNTTQTRFICIPPMKAEQHDSRC